MVDGGRELGFAMESLQVCFVGAQASVENLECDDLAGLGVESAVDGPLTA